MFEVEINRSKCIGCGACTKVSQILYVDDDNLINMRGGVVEDNMVDGFVKSIYEIETSASICPEDCFTVYDDDTGDEIEIERHAKI